ncbi:hypothetical protein BRADI_4g36026v3 [Brachypodium distachyon]|uniref:Uncharacterized protein n=1 Tax=Brachypodium distachyon TaxID=15368 RepID=A0A2K2CSK0_BRADI|nr:hypothetical protein BRADI_4g36026v3 [Brachypodium distachyon]
MNRPNSAHRQRDMQPCEHLFPSKERKKCEHLYTENPSPESVGQQIKPQSARKKNLASTMFARKLALACTADTKRPAAHDPWSRGPGHKARSDSIDPGGTYIVRSTCCRLPWVHVDVSVHRRGTVRRRTRSWADRGV